MPNEPIFECSVLFTKVSVYPDRIEERKPLGLGKRSIGIKQVASVETSPLLGTAKVETTGGHEYKFNIGSRANLQAFEEAVRGLIGG
jgi:hypothetical protein